MPESMIPPPVSLERFLAWLVYVLIGFAAFYGALGISFHDLATVWSAAAITIISIVVVYARAKARHGQSDDATLMVGCSFLGAVICMAFLLPGLTMSYGVVPLVIALLGLVYTPKVPQRLVIWACWLASIGVFLAGWLSPLITSLPTALLTQIGFSTIIGNITFAFILSRQLYHRLTMALQQSHESHVRIAHAHAVLADSARHDTLTGLLNRGEFERTAADIIMLASESTSPISVVVLDIDHYKKLNDTFGHAAGDYVLRVFGETLRTVLHTSGWAFRYGGDEFVLLLPQMEKETTLHWVAQFQERVSALSLSYDGKMLETITLSIGVAFSPEDGRSLEVLINAADSALYAAKRAGRNCVRLANTVGLQANTTNHELALPHSIRKNIGTTTNL